MRRRRRLAWRAWKHLLIVVIVFALLVVGAAPLAFGRTRDATRAEGEQLLGSARDAFRVEYSKTDSVQAARETFAAAVQRGEFEGSYDMLNAGVTELPDGRVRLKAPSVSGKLEVGSITFDLNSGYSTIEWHDTDPDV